MRTWLLGDSDTDTKSKLAVLARRHAFILLVALNLVVAVALAYAVRVAENRPHSILGQVSSAPTTTSSPSPSPTPTPSIDLNPQVNTDHWVSWAVLDKSSGKLAGSANWDQTQYVLSSIKPWIAADYFNSHPNPSQDVLDAFSTMILDSNDEVAYAYFAGGPSLARLTKTCGLTDLLARDWSWSLTSISARDAVRYMDCIYSGKATSPQWTAWIVDKMRHVRGEGDFGPRELFNPRTQIATKNGWYDWEGKWYINCLAENDDWAIAILQQFPAPGRWSGGDLKPGVEQADPVCTSVAQQVLRLNA